VYATVFLLVELTYIALMREAFRPGCPSPADRRTQRVHFIRAWIMVAIFAFAAAVFIPAGIRLILTTTFLLLHLRPDLRRAPSARH
jgi:hypothetical protein